MVPKWESVIYRQGESWDTCQPAGFLSKKFTSTQHNYGMHEHETLAVLEALMKWEDKLLGRKFTVVTDHKGLEYFKTQLNLLLRQTRWWEYLSHFNYNTIYVDGTQNQVQTACHATMNMILLRMNTPIVNLSKRMKYSSRWRLSTHPMIHRNMKPSDQMITKTAGENSYSMTRKSDVK